MVVLNIPSYNFEYLLSDIFKNQWHKFAILINFGAKPAKNLNVWMFSCCRTLRQEEDIKPPSLLLAPWIGKNLVSPTPFFLHFFVLFAFILFAESKEY